MSPQQNAAVLRPKTCSTPAPTYQTWTQGRVMNRVWDRQSIDPRTSHAFAPKPLGGPAAAAGSPLKRAFDVAVSAAMLVALAPFLLLIALLVRLDSEGPVFFLQERTGLGGRRFQIIKFRTMNVMENGHTVVQARINDHRVTRLGALLRRTSLDELPQLWNVLRGEMSLIGPRPHAIAHDMHYGVLLVDYAERFRVRPGMSGLAQVNGSRGPTETVEKMARRLQFDLAYVEQWSWWMEIKVIFGTLRVLVRGDAF
jgi:putative colanic acid biosysnthesis UDP-glucose lipid carrier transferase